MPLEYGGEIKILNNGMEFLPAFLNAMRNAKKSINITTFVWDDGKMSNVIFRILIEQSEKGVEVRILLDGVAGLRTPISKILELKNAGGRFEMFRPPRFGKLTRLHRRNHRRALVIDGEVAFTGGMSIGDQWLGNAENLKEWRDMMFEVKGRMAHSLQGVFAELWTGTTGEMLVGEKFYPKIADIDEKVPYISIASSPTVDTAPLANFYWFSIHVAEKKAYLMYPYVIPEKHIVQALRERARAGVDVRLLVPNRNTDWRLIRWASQSYYESFLRAGIKIYEYQPTLIHGKLLIVDGVWSVIGSANMDIRSKIFNEENVMGIKDEKFAANLETVFMTDLERAKELSLGEWRKNNKLARFLGRILLLFTKQY